jgi:SAM-dependent methyltransferase
MTNTTLIIKQYEAAFAEHGRSSAAVLCPKGRHDVRFDALTAAFDLRGLRVLDFGCGLGHLCDYLSARDIACDYLGVDIVHDFIVSNQDTYPTRRFMHIESLPDVPGRFDVVIASGVFNLRYDDDEAVNQSIVEQHLADLYARANVGLAVDFMTTHVDFQRPEAFHADPAWAIGFVIRQLGRRVIVNHTYLPFEFSVSVLKSATIDREAGRYV